MSLTELAANMNEQDQAAISMQSEINAARQARRLRWETEAAKAEGDEAAAAVGNGARDWVQFWAPEIVEGVGDGETRVGDGEAHVGATDEAPETEEVGDEEDDEQEEEEVAAGGEGERGEAEAAEGNEDAVRLCGICADATECDAKWLTCGHVFHQRCLNEVMRVSGVSLESLRCPECRQDANNMMDVEINLAGSVVGAEDTVLEEVEQEQEQEQAAPEEVEQEQAAPEGQGRGRQDRILISNKQQIFA